MCQMRVMFSRSSSPSSGNIQAMSSGLRSGGNGLAMTPTAVAWSGTGMRSLMMRYRCVSSLCR